MIKIYEDGSVFIGDIKDGMKCGKGVYYCLGKFKTGHKIEGVWVNDKLSGWAIEYHNGISSSGYYIDGKREGTFLINRANGNSFTAQFKNNKNVGAEMLTDSQFKKLFGSKRLDEKTLYLGDLNDDIPNGFGMLYSFDNKKLTCKKFGHFENGELVDVIDFKTIMHNYLIK